MRRGAAGDALDPAVMAAKMRHYEYLLPGAPPALVAKMSGGTPLRSGALGPADVPAAGIGTGLPTWPALDPATARDQALGCFLGLGVGDAVGAAVEFPARDSFPPVTDMVGGGPFDLAPGEWTDDTTMALSAKPLFIDAGEWRGKRRDQIRASGYVVNTLEAAPWSVWQADDFREAVLTAANLGDDADSVAAVAGQLAGALYRASAIPPEWLGRLAWRDELERLANALFDRSPAAGVQGDGLPTRASPR